MLLPYVKSTEIAKVTQDPNSNTIFIEGIATDTGRDVQGDIASETFLAKAAMDLNNNLPVLLNHNGERTIGRVIEARLVNEGKKIWVKAAIDTDDPDVRRGILDGRIRYFSVGGWATKVDKAMINGRPTNICIDGYVQELSVTPVPIKPTAMFRVTKGEGDAAGTYSEFIGNLLRYTVKKAMENSEKDKDVLFSIIKSYVEEKVEKSIMDSISDKIVDGDFEGLTEDEKSILFSTINNLQNNLTKGIISNESQVEDSIMSKELRKADGKWDSLGPAGKYAGKDTSGSGSSGEEPRDESNGSRSDYDRAVSRTGKDAYPDPTEFNSPPSGPDPKTFIRDNDVDFKGSIPGSAKNPSPEQLISEGRESSATNNEGIIHASSPTISLLPDGARRSATRDNIQKSVKNEMENYRLDKAEGIYTLLHEVVPHYLGKSYRGDFENELEYIHRQLHEMENVPEDSPAYNSYMNNIIYSVNKAVIDADSMPNFDRILLDHINGVDHRAAFGVAFVNSEPGRILEKAMKNAAAEEFMTEFAGFVNENVTGKMKDGFISIVKAFVGEGEIQKSADEVEPVEKACESGPMPVVKETPEIAGGVPKKTVDVSHKKAVMSDDEVLKLSKGVMAQMISENLEFDVPTPNTYITGRPVVENTNGSTDAFDVAAFKVLKTNSYDR